MIRYEAGRSHSWLYAGAATSADKGRKRSLFDTARASSISIQPHRHGFCATDRQPRRKWRSSVSPKAYHAAGRDGRAAQAKRLVLPGTRGCHQPSSVIKAVRRLWRAALGSLAGSTPHSCNATRSPDGQPPSSGHATLILGPPLRVLVQTLPPDSAGDFRPIVLPMKSQDRRLGVVCQALRLHSPARKPIPETGHFPASTTWTSTNVVFPDACWGPCQQVILGLTHQTKSDAKHTTSHQAAG